MKRQIHYKVSKVDWILTIILLSISVGSLISYNNMGLDNDKIALIYKNNGLLMEVDLSKDEVIDLAEMVVEVKKDRVRALKADCPHQICVHAGWISSPSQTIVCVTNKVLIEISGKSPDADYNAISY
ncbi:MAG: NusG domain II-containing protein [Armatimonadetes bacterium]|nr:NusG domain II-containing protein [Armatimonadota bacterium]